MAKKKTKPRAKGVKGYVHSGSILAGIFIGCSLVLVFQYWERSARARAATLRSPLRQRRVRPARARFRTLVRV